MIAYETRIGKIHISEEYLTKLIGQAVTSCFGVVGMVPSGSRQKLFDLLSKKENLNKGIIIRGDADSISIELHIMVSYGMNINAIAQSIVHKVEYTVTESTGIKVDKVTVKVDGIKD
ncbi:MAG: Asp23/Gls24 family envelope stress response protein [Clostridia bacterium]|nr:Asp23/Gls24 family envelope stress response protein [Clostridia bacterium]